MNINNKKNFLNILRQCYRDCIKDITFDVIDMKNVINGKTKGNVNICKENLKKNGNLIIDKFYEYCCDEKIETDEKNFDKFKKKILTNDTELDNFMNKINALPGLKMVRGVFGYENASIIANALNYNKVVTYDNPEEINDYLNAVCVYLEYGLQNLDKK